MIARVLNISLYQIGWFCCVLGPANGWPWIGAAIATLLLLTHVALVDQPRREIALVIAAAVIGGIADSAQSCAGLLRFTAGDLVGCLAPPWILLLWMQFATLMRFSLSFLSGRPVIAALLGGAGGPLAFWVGSRLGAVRFADPSWHSLAVLAIVWAVAFPLLLALARRGGRPDRPLRYRTSVEAKTPG